MILPNPWHSSPTYTLSRRHFRIGIPVIVGLATLLLVHGWYTGGGVMAVVGGRGDPATLTGSAPEIPDIVMHKDETYDLQNVRSHLESKLKFVPQLNISDAQSFALPTSYSAVLLYLVSLRRSRELLLSLSYLYKNVPLYPWPILLFHTGDYTDPALQAELRKQMYAYLGGGSNEWYFVERLEFVLVKWTLPDGLSRDVNVVEPVFKDAWPGYHQMCAFFATHIFDHPRLQNVTYYMRLDSDSYVLKPMCYDPIERAHQHRLSYAWRYAKRDPEFVTHGLWEYVDRYASTHSFRPAVGLPPNDEEDDDYEPPSTSTSNSASHGEEIGIDTMLERNGFVWPGGKVTSKDREKMKTESFLAYYNNFEVVKLDAFRRPEVRAWLDDLMSDPERVFKWRWGDAPIRYATVNMFFDVATEVEEYCDIEYYHQGLMPSRCACEPLL